jgi:hypothetical protein
MKLWGAEIHKNYYDRELVSSRHFPKGTNKLRGATKHVTLPYFDLLF